MENKENVGYMANKQNIKNDDLVKKFAQNLVISGAKCRFSRFTEESKGESTETETPTGLVEI